jgi:hypothetical protein
MGEPITAAQRKKIFAVTRELGIDDDLRRAVIQNVAGKESMSKLTKAEAIRVIDELERRIGRTRSGRASRKQIWKINELARALGWADNPKRVQGFVKKYAGVDRLEWLTTPQAWRVIEGLKKLLERQEQGAAEEA